MKVLSLSSCALVALLTNGHNAATVPWIAADSCETLISSAPPHVQITRAQLVPAGRFAGTSSGFHAPDAPAFKPYSALQDFCRVAATLTPSIDSDIKVEIWMPAANWNSRLEAIGNGGWGGLISVQQLAVAVGRGSAAVMTDT